MVSVGSHNMRRSFFSRFSFAFLNGSSSLFSWDVDMHSTWSAPVLRFLVAPSASELSRLARACATSVLCALSGAYTDGYRLCGRTLATIVTTRQPVSRASPDPVLKQTHSRACLKNALWTVEFGNMVCRSRFYAHSLLHWSDHCLHKSVTNVKYRLPFTHSGGGITLWNDMPSAYDTKPASQAVIILLYRRASGSTEHKDLLMQPNTKTRFWAAITAGFIAFYIYRADAIFTGQTRRASEFYLALTERNILHATRPDPAILTLLARL